jgi:antitoxin component YwqK of YwqJK toxin-antitoxin module
LYNKVNEFWFFNVCHLYIIHKMKIYIYGLFTLIITISCNNYKQKNIIINLEDNKSLKIKFDSNTGIIEEIAHYKFDSIREGETVYFNENGDILSKINYKENKANGPAFYFYKSGFLNGMYLYQKNNKIDDAYVYYDGRINLLKNYLFYNQNGYLIYKATYNKNTKLIKEDGHNPF